MLLNIDLETKSQ